MTDRHIPRPVVLLIAGFTLCGCMAAGCGGTSTGTASHSASNGSAPGASGSSESSAQPTSVSGDSVVGSAQGVTATLHAASHHPTVGRPWPIEFTATRAGHPARASVSYEYLYAGQVVARRSHYTFTGHFADTFDWPASAVGYPLTLRAVIVSEGVTINLDFPVQVAA